MRFLADGPRLPDEVLAARDEGRVLFFCGAGISRARAGLPDFLGLAKCVLRELRALPESAAQKLVDTAEIVKPIAGVGGILAADRVFGLLERDFSIADIERAVGAALEPQENVDLSAHRTMLALSRGTSGNVQLVTTNFDLLFKAAVPAATIWTPNRLPDLSRVEGFEGIVHLHGVFDPAYRKSADGNLVLSSAEFGRAYLAEGWATNFIRAAIRRYLIVFVGYAADDPPVQYLLEALNRVSDTRPYSLYAFQSGREDDAKALWAQKGVRAIAYAPDNGHAALWETLNAWVDRARDPERWRERLIRRAWRGPQALRPHERGQIVHLALTEDGARSISKATRTIPSTWLCAFDPRMRYGQPGKRRPLEVNSSEIDPFSDYGLDSDLPPLPRRENQYFQPRETPTDAMNVLIPNSLDQLTSSGRFRGHETLHTSDLSPRMASLAVWLSRVCDEPAAVWWASGQAGLHPAVIRQIAFALYRNNPAAPAMARSAWRYLFDGWKTPSERGFMDAFTLKDEIDRDGWTKQHIRRFAEIFGAKLKISRSHWAGPLAPRTRKWSRVRDLIDLEVHYPNRDVRFEIPDDQLFSVISLLRQNLEHMIDLECEINSRFLPHIAPIEPDPNLTGRSSERDFGINLYVLDFANLFRRLVQHDKVAASHELAAWRQSDDPVFGRLRIWAAGLQNFLDDETASEILANACDPIFWGIRDQRDLLLSLRRRWQTMPANAKATIEARLLAGPPPVKRTSAARNRQWRAIGILERVMWLRGRGCTFATNVEKTLTQLRRVVPRWTPAQAGQAADSRESRGGSVRTDTSFQNVENVPISELIPWAMQGQKRVWGELQEYDPFAGLCERRPVLVLAALRYQLRDGADVAPAWSSFLYSGARLTDKPKIIALIARRLAGLPQPAAAAIVIPASYWLWAVHKRLFACDPDAIYDLFNRLTDALAERPQTAEPKAQAPGEARDWATSASGSAAGHLVDVLFGEPELAEIGTQDALPESWLTRAERLLSLPGDHGHLSLVHLARHLGWLHIHCATWSERNIAATMLGDGAPRDAALAGFLTNPQVSDERLYVLLKPLLIDLARAGRQSERRDMRALGNLFMQGWLTRNDTGARWFSDDEFRRILIYGDEGLRRHVLWQVERLGDFMEKVEFLRSVWPRQLSVRTPVTVGQLCTMAFEDEMHFVELADAILPLVSRADGGSLTLPLAHDKKEGIARNYPDKALELLSAVLPDDVTNWPYGVAETLDLLVQTNPTLSADPRTIRLRGIWNRR